MGNPKREEGQTRGGDRPAGRTLLTFAAALASLTGGAAHGAAATGAAATKLVPIVLDVAGVGSSHYTTELTLANRGTTAATAQMTYTPATALGATGGGKASVSLSAGQQLVFPDTIAWLRTQGLAIPAGSSQGGTLAVAFSGLSSREVAYAGARTTTPSGNGRAGLSYSGIDLASAATGTSFLYGLRSTSEDRTNLALANAGSAPVTLRVTLYSGDAGDSRTYVDSPDTVLGPGQWTQLSRVLDPPGFTNAYAKVEVVSGTGPYVAYAVFNDNATNDGSFVPAERSVLPPEPRLIPALVETSTFESELVLANPLAVPQTATLKFVDSATPGPDSGGTVAVSLGAGEQRIIPSAIDFLRQNKAAVGPKGPPHAGALSVTFRRGTSASYGFAGARTSAPVSGGGTGEYGVFYPGVSDTFAALSEAWVYGLRQDGSNRSNLAVANLSEGGDSLTFRADVYDGTTGRLAGSTPPGTLAPGGWTQLNAVLQPFGVSNGYVRVVKLAGSARFLAYGVVNDGGAPGLGTSDGSFVSGLPASSQAIRSISVCAGGSGSACVDTHKPVLGPDGAVVNTSLAGASSDEHSAILPPGAAGDNTDYLIFVASGTRSVNPDVGMVVLSGAAGPDATGQWHAAFAAGYGDYGSNGRGAVFLAPTVQGRCPDAASPAVQDQTFDLVYAAPGSVVVDPTRPPGHLLTVYEGANSCIGTTGGTKPGNGAYITTGIATSNDGGRTWPSYRGTPTFSFVDLPMANKTQGPSAPFGATGAAVCAGNDCSVTLPASEGRYAVLTVPSTLDSFMRNPASFGANVGTSEPSAFVDDVAAGPNSAPWVYAVHQYLPGDSSLPGRNADVSLARARLTEGAAVLQFSKWDGNAFASPGIGGSDTPILPNGSFAACGDTSQNRSQASITFVDETRQYLLLFVCNSPGDPATGRDTKSLGSAWFWAASDDLSEPARWSTPQEVAGTWQPWDTGTPPGTYGCPSYEGWYPTLMSPGRATGHIGTSGYTFYMSGCLGGSQGTPPKRQYMTRQFTIAVTPSTGGEGTP